MLAILKTLLWPAELKSRKSFSTRKKNNGKKLRIAKMRGLYSIDVNYINLPVTSLQSFNSINALVNSWIFL